MDIKTLQIVYEDLSRKCSALTRESFDADFQGERELAARLFDQMRGVRAARDRVQALIDEAVGL